MELDNNVILIFDTFVIIHITQVPRYLLFCDRGSFSAKAFTLVGTDLNPVE